MPSALAYRENQNKNAFRFETLSIKCYILFLMATNAQTTEVKLLGQKIVLRTSETDPEVIQEVLQLVSKKISEAEGRGRGAAPHQVALLALLDLAEEYVKAKKRTTEFKNLLEDKSNQLLSLVEAELK